MVQFELLNAEVGAGKKKKKSGLAALFGHDDDDEEEEDEDEEEEDDSSSDEEGGGGGAGGGGGGASEDDRSQARGGDGTTTPSVHPEPKPEGASSDGSDDDSSSLTRVESAMFQAAAKAKCDLQTLNSKCTRVVRNRLPEDQGWASCHVEEACCTLVSERWSQFEPMFFSGLADRGGRQCLVLGFPQR